MSASSTIHHSALDAIADYDSSSCVPVLHVQTVCLVALITAYQYQHPEIGKLIYCTRTLPELVKAVEEIKRVIRYREKQLGPAGSKVWGKP